MQLRAYDELLFRLRNVTRNYISLLVGILTVDICLVSHTALLRR